MKICISCLVPKKLEEFYSDKTKKDSKCSKCKICCSIRSKQHYAKHSESVNLRVKAYTLQHKDSIKKYKKFYSVKNREKIKERARIRRADPNFRIIHNLRNRINKAIKRDKGVKTNHTQNLLGCTISQFKEHLTKYFYSNPQTNELMTWDNYGRFGWHVDHIRPCASFDLSDPEQQKRCFHYTNLQPLWWFDNAAKYTHF